MKTTMKQINCAVIAITLALGLLLLVKYHAPSPAPTEKEHKILHEVSMRYLKVFKSPSTIEEQVIFDYITKGREEFEGVKIDSVISSPPACEILIK